AAPFRARKCVTADQAHALLYTFNGAAPFRARKFLRGSVNVESRTCHLQWGRALSSAEMTPALKSSLSAFAFNGAAPFRARKCKDLTPCLNRLNHHLQWGRALSSAEMDR